MRGQTVTEWLTDNKVNEESINFIETVLTFTSSVQLVTAKEEIINKKLQSFFPNKKAIIKPDLSYQDFTQILKDNDIKVDPDELLNKYRSQGICIELCDELLKRKSIRKN